MAWLRPVARPAGISSALVIGLLAAALLAGCTSPNVGDAPEASPAGNNGGGSSQDAGIKASVTRAYITSGFEQSCYSTEDVCHRFEVALDNSASSKDFDASFGWKGLDSSGGIRTCIKDDGPDGIAAGGSGQVTVECDMPDGSVRINKIQYNGFSAKSFSMTVPTY